MRYNLIAIALLALSYAACGSDPEGHTTVERTDSAGVEIVMNRGDDVPLEWTFTPTLTLGGAPSGPESFYALVPEAVATDADGNIYVLHYDRHRVVVFDSTGKHVRTMGGEGGGPGELESPSGLAVGPNGTVGVWDFDRHAIVRFSEHGSVLGPLRIDAFVSGPIARTELGWLVTAADRQRTRLLAVRPDSSRMLAALARPQPEPTDYGCVGLALPPFFAPALVWAARNDDVIVNRSPRYVIGIYENGRMVASIRRDVAPRPATREMAVREAIQRMGEDGMTVTFPGGKCVIGVEEVVDGRGYADVLPTIEALALAPDGTIWVRRGAVEDQAAKIDVFAPDGEYMGTLPPSAPFPVAFLPDGRIVAIEQNAMDVEYLVVYRVDWTGKAP